MTTNDRNFPERGRIEFAPDGLHFQLVKRGRLDNLWDFFTTDSDIRSLTLLNPYAKFRLIGSTGQIIAELPRKEDSQ